MKKLSTLTRVVLAISSLLVILAFYYPLWNIWLFAPQYPEGLELRIWINRLEGDIDIINGLNHYIGMRFIHEETFPELRYMTKIMIGLIAVGMIAAIANRRFLLLTFVLLIVGVGVAGMIDYYIWAYDYGHHLDPHAAIKVPGMSYQPPMLGTKHLLNFTATAWPGIGGIAIICTAVISLALLIFELTRRYDKVTV